MDGNITPIGLTLLETDLLKAVDLEANPRWYLVRTQRYLWQDIIVPRMKRGFKPEPLIWNLLSKMEAGLQTVSEQESRDSAYLALEEVRAALATRTARAV